MKTTVPTAGSSVEPWQLSYDDMPEGAFADGLRLSTDCLSRRIIEPLDPDRYHEFPDHLSKRGHGFERVMQEWLWEKHGVRAEREIVVPWEHGETHLDLLVDPAGAAKLWGCTHGGWLLIELKANKEGSVKAENVRQAQRQRFVIERAVEQGKTIRYQKRVDDGWEWDTVPLEVMANLQYRVVVIDPTTWRIPDPRGVAITLTEERRGELDAEWATMDAIMALPVNDIKWIMEWPEKMERHGAPCTCGKCHIPTIEELPKELFEHAAAHMEAKAEEKFAADAKAYHASVLKAGVTVLRSAGKGVDAKGSWVGGGLKVTLTKAGSVLTNKSDAKPTPIV